MWPIWVAVVFALNLAAAPLDGETQPAARVPRMGYLAPSQTANVASHAKKRLPAVYSFRSYVEAGGLMQTR